ALTLNLDNLYIGGGQSTQGPSVVPDYYLPAIFKVASCTPRNLTLTNATSGETGSSPSCTNARCSYRPPTPVVNTNNTALSACVLNSLSANASGTLACSNGASNLNLPLSAATFGLGDVMFMRCGPLTPDPNNRGRVCNVDANCGGVAGSCVFDNGPGATNVQPCPICNPSTLKCNGGAKDGTHCAPPSIIPQCRTRPGSGLRPPTPAP